MIKTYISALFAVLFVVTQATWAQTTMDDVYTQLSGGQVGQTSGSETEVVQAGEAAVVGSELFAKGVSYYRAGDFKEAVAVFEAILSKDPFDRRAMEYLRRTAKKMAAYEVRKQSTTRASALAEVDAAWNPEYKGYVPSAGNGGPEKPTTSGSELMVARLKQIIIPSLDFRDANIKDVVLFLTETCRRIDSKGVNILLLGMAAGEEQENITISIADMNLFDSISYIVEIAGLKFDIKPDIVRIMPLAYDPDPQVRKTFDIIPEVGMEMESMSGDSGGGADDLFGESSASEAAGPVDVVGFFSIVDFPEGASAVYQPNFHKLFVRNTQKNIDAIAEILGDLEDEAISKRAQQVEIEAKFVEFSEGALEELGFDWNVYGDDTFLGLEMKELPSGKSYLEPAYGYDTEVDTKIAGRDVQVYTDPVTGVTGISGTDGKSRGQNLFGASQRDNATAFQSIQSGLLSTMGGNPATMFFTNGDIDLKLSAMEQEGTADVLSAPKVTTKSGNEAIIRVVETHRYPQDYDVETGQRTTPVVKPQDWEDIDLGVSLKVTPVVDAESNTIDLDLQPEIKKFIDYDDYVVGFNLRSAGGNNSEDIVGDGSALFARMPFFEVRSVQTQVTIADGNTVLMGGLVDERTETFRDQVPILGDIPYIGRLFRTEGSRTAKKNLVIYVKATQVDDRGMTRSQRELARQTAAN